MTESTQSVERSISRNRLIIDAVTAESWEYSDSNTQYLTHNIHRYSGKFIPQIAGRAISILTAPGELVVDPYCGSGTTLLESALLGRRAVGVDLNPLAILISSTKVTPVSAKDLAGLRHLISEELASYTLDEDMPLFRGSSNAEEMHMLIQRDRRVTDGWYTKWFQQPVLADLIAIDHVISRIRNPDLVNVARVAFSDILRKSSNAHSGYPNVMFDKNASERPRPIKRFLKALVRVCGMVSTLENVNARWKDVQATEGNATAIRLEDSSVDAVITHPPYIGSVPYAEYGSISLTWMGIDPKSLDRDLTGGRRQSRDVIQRFRHDYGKMLAESSRILRPGRHAFLMVGNPVVRGESIDLASMTQELAERTGFRLIVRTARKGVNRRANKMGTEYLLIFENAG